MLGLLHHPPMPSLPGSFQRVAVCFSFLATLSVPHPRFGGVVGRGRSTVLEGLLRHNSLFVQPQRDDLPSFADLHSLQQVDREEDKVTFPLGYKTLIVSISSRTY
jgi:hypothetical protein